jgi:hypothetical protein
MKFLSGVVIGVTLTIGAAYIHDMLYAPVSAANAESRPMVNWDAVGAAAHNAVANAREQWDKLSAK